MALPKKRDMPSERTSVAKKPGMRTYQAPKGLPAPSAVGKAKERVPEPQKKEKVVGSGKAVETPKKSLPAPKKEVAKSVAKKVGGAILKRAGALGAAVSVGMAIKDAMTSKKEAPAKKTPNVESTGKKTEIKVDKKPVTPGKKPSTPESAKPKGKSATRVAFEKEFAKQRKSGAKEFTFRGKRYNTKLA